MLRETTASKGSEPTLASPRELSQALDALWRLPPPGPRDLLSAPAFVRLRETCEELYLGAGKKTGLAWALSNALRALGLPCGLPPEDQDLALSVELATRELDLAFGKGRSTRVHLCPLDCADDLPALTFGSNRVVKLSASELKELVDWPRLRRTFPKLRFDADSFSEFTWLEVRESVPLDPRVGARAVPFFYLTWETDFGAIKPHENDLSPAVQLALAFLLLAPWDDWMSSPAVEWRAFRMPWTYTVDDDIFRSPVFPPPADSLSWQPDILFDKHGNEIDLGEKPVRLELEQQSFKELATWINDTSWSEFANAQASPLFEGPVLHFLLRGYQSSGIDEFLSHITVIDAALGLPIDYHSRARPQFPNTKPKNPGATARTAARLSALLRDQNAQADYAHLFNTRSEFVHGRRMEAIPGKDRLLARRLARRVIVALLDVAKTGQVTSRDNYLQKLLQIGLARNTSP